MRDDERLQIQHSLAQLIGKSIADCLRDLLQTKHLYQSVVIDVEPSREALRSAFKGAYSHDFIEATEILNKLLGLLWEPFARPSEVSLSSSQKELESIFVELPTVKLFCLACDRIEAYNAIDLRNSTVAPNTKRSLVQPRRPTTGFAEPPPVQQTLVLSYQCQSCKEMPEAFLLHRSAFKLTLCGRQPIETVDVPRFIPKDQKKHFSGAIVAHQSGQTLAGLFLLRTFIEQFCIACDESKKLLADAAVAAYTRKLPEDFKKLFPSLGKLYSDLSAAIHSASEDTQLFEAARGDLIEHFDARRIHKLS